VADKATPQQSENEQRSRPFLVACILTLNEEDNISEAIRSVREISDETVVVDSGSTDRTVEIASDEGARVWSRRFDTENQQRNWAAGAIENQWPGAWIIEIDADERLTPQLGAEIRSELSSNPARQGYLIKLRVIFDGRLLRFGGLSRTWLPRLRRATAGRYEDRPVNPHLIVSHGRLGRLKAHIYHTDVASWERHLDKHNLYSSLEAKARFRAVAEPSLRIGTLRALRFPHLRRRWLREHVWNALPAKPVIYFLHSYALHFGWVDGRSGLRHAVFRSWQTMCTDLKYRELCGDQTGTALLPDEAPSWERYLSRQNEMTTQQALAEVNSCRKPLHTVSPVWKGTQPLLCFAQAYLLEGGALRGYAGLCDAMMRAWNVTCVQLKTEELERVKAAGGRMHIAST
jgi:glycosyltransferase involved in cell wall biosynthesis